MIKYYNYARVSTTQQNVTRQTVDCLEYLKKQYNVDAFDVEFTEYKSGKNIENREQLQLLLKIIDANSVIVVYSIDRLARSLLDFNKIVNAIASKNATLHIVKDNLTVNLNDATSKLMLNILSSFAEFERQVIVDRVKHGLKIAKLKGKKLGRPSKVNLCKDDYNELYKDLLTNKHTIVGLARKYKVARQSIYRYVKKMGLTQQGGRFIDATSVLANETIPTLSKTLNYITGA